MDLFDKRIGFACHIIKNDGTFVDGTRMRTTKVSHYNTLSRRDQEEKIYSIVNNNMLALLAQVEWLAKQPEPLRFMRISSDLLPLYTYPGLESVYSLRLIDSTLKYILPKVGQIAKDNKIILSSHPGQYTVLNNPDKRILEAAIKDLEYHNYLFELMGLSHNDNSNINIHAGSRKNGLEQFIKNSKFLSNSCRSLLSIENDEYSFGIDDLLNSNIPNLFKIVLDVHHEWIFSGNYIYADDPRLNIIKQSWNGKVLKTHISMSPENLVYELTLNEKGLHVAPTEKRSKLRKHSDFIWSTEFRKYAVSFLRHGNLMIESKKKNLAALQIYEEII